MKPVFFSKTLFFNLFRFLDFVFWHLKCLFYTVYCSKTLTVVQIYFNVSVLHEATNKKKRGCCGRDRIVVGFTTNCNQCLSSLNLWVWTPFRRGVLDTTLCDTVCQWLSTGWWFSPGTPVSSTNKTYHDDITEILL